MKITFSISLEEKILTLINEEARKESRTRSNWIEFYLQKHFEQSTNKDVVE